MDGWLVPEKLSPGQQNKERSFGTPPKTYSRFQAVGFCRQPSVKGKVNLDRGAKANSGPAPNYLNIFGDPQITCTVSWRPTFLARTIILVETIFLNGVNTFSFNTFNCVFESLQKKNDQKSGNYAH